jgi:hypothetical protein
MIARERNEHLGLSVTIEIAKGPARQLVANG